MLKTYSIVLGVLSFCLSLAVGGCGGATAESDNTTVAADGTADPGVSDSAESAPQGSGWDAYVPKDIEPEKKTESEQASLPDDLPEGEKAQDELDDFDKCGDDPMCGGMLSMGDDKTEEKKKKKGQRRNRRRR